MHIKKYDQGSVLPPAPNVDEHPHYPRPKNQDEWRTCSSQGGKSIIDGKVAVKDGALWEWSGLVQ